MNKIIIELAAEDRKRLDDILAALQNGPDCDKCVQTVAAAIDRQNEPQSEEKPQAKEEPEAPAFVEVPPGLDAVPWEDEVPVEAAEPEVLTTMSAHNLAEVQRKVVELCAAGHKTEVRAIVNGYASNVSGIPEEKYDEVMEKLLKLEG